MHIYIHTYNIYIYIYIDKYRYVQYTCLCILSFVLSSLFLLPPSFSCRLIRTSYRSANSHEPSLASAAARLERGETCAASYIPRWAKGESGKGVGGATDEQIESGGERSHSGRHEWGNWQGRETSTCRGRSTY